MSIFKTILLSLCIWSSLAAQAPATNPAGSSEPAAPQVATPVSGQISCVKAAIALNVNNLEPENVADTFPSEVKRLFCFSQIKGAAEPEEIQHRWYWNDDLISSVSLKITTANFRTYSAKTIPNSMMGDWRVVIVNSKNEEILRTLKFTIK